jgi:hypothetical protein
VSWHQLMTHYRDQILACDFFTVETLCMQTVYVLFPEKLLARWAAFVLENNGVFACQQAGIRSPQQRLVAK